MTLVHRQTLKKKRDLYLFLPVPTCHAHPSHQSPPSFPPITCQPPSSLPSHHVVILNLQLSCQPPSFLPTHHAFLPFQVSHVNPPPSSPPITPSSLSNCHMSTPLLPPHPSRHPPFPSVTCQPPSFLPTHHAILPFQVSHVNPPPSSPPITPSSLSKCHMSTPLLPPHPSHHPPFPSVTCQPPSSLPTHHVLLPLQLSPIIPTCHCLASVYFKHLTILHRTLLQQPQVQSQGQPHLFHRLNPFPAPWHVVLKLGHSWRLEVSLQFFQKLIHTL